jgi:hypothetical protein
VPAFLAISFYPRLSGYLRGWCRDVQNNVTKITSQPSDAGRTPDVEPGGLTMTITDSRKPMIQVAGIEGKPLCGPGAGSKLLVR